MKKKIFRDTIVENGNIHKPPEKIWCLNPIVSRYKRRYIYGIDSDSIGLFCMLSSMRVYIEGFVENDFAGNTIYHKIVYSIEQLDNIEEILLIMPNNKESLEQYNVCYEPFILNNDLQSKKIYIYGAGYVGSLVFEYLNDKKVEVEGFIESDYNKIGGVVQGKPIFGKEKLDDLDAETVIIEAGKYYKEIDDTVFQIRNDLKRFFCNDRFGLNYYRSARIYIDYEKGIFWSKSSLMELDEFYSDRKLILYGNDIELAHKYCDVFTLLDFDNICIASEEADGEKYSGMCIEDVLFETNYIILLYGEKTEKVISKMEVLGLEEVKNFVHINQPNIFYRINHRTQILDVNLGYTYRMNSEYPGIYVYGENKESDCKIAVLGGSTSDSTLLPFKSWVEFFYEMYCNERITIFNGAIGGYNSSQELIKLMRDIVCLKPDMVLVYDGYNDARDAWKKIGSTFAFSYVMDIFNKVNGTIPNCGCPISQSDIDEIWGGGILSERSVIDIWIKNIEYMHAVAEINDIKFYAFLQPMLPSKIKFNEHECSMMKMIEDLYSESVIETTKMFRNTGKEISDAYEYIYDLSAIFDDADVYMDICHVYEKGNQIIASTIYEILKNNGDMIYE